MNAHKGRLVITFLNLMTTALITNVTTVPLISFAQSSDLEQIMEKISARYESHANGHIKYERKVYYKEGLTLEDVRKADGIVDDWAENRLLAVHDMNDFYYEKLDGSPRYRLDAKNLLNAEPQSMVTTDTKVTLDQAVRDYNRIYLYDQTNDEQVIYFKKKNDDPVFLYRKKLDPRVNLDPPYLYDGGQLPTALLFSRFSRWGLWRSKNKNSLFLKEKDGQLVSFSFETSEALYNLVADADRNVLISEEYNQSSGHKLLGYVPLCRTIYQDYSSSWTELLPRKIQSQHFDKDVKKYRVVTKTLPMKATTVEIEVLGVEFDNPRFSEMISMAEFEDTEVVDYRFDLSDPAFYKARPNLTDAEILSMKDKEKRERRIKELTRPALWGAGIAVFFFALGLWYFRGKRRDAQQIS